MRKFQIEGVDRLNKLPKSYLNEMKEFGLITGSVVFGGWTKESDIDIIFVRNNKFMAKIQNYIIPASGSINDGANFYAYYAKYEDFYLNLIVTENEDQFNVWKKSHNLLMDLKKHSPLFAKQLENKEFRVKQFQLFRETFGWGDDEKGSIETPGEDIYIVRR